MNPDAPKPTVQGTPTDGIVVCDACPVECRIRPNQTGACDRYGNFDGKVVRIDPVVVLQKTLDQSGRVVPFLQDQWDGSWLPSGTSFITGVGAGTTYPDYKPAPFIVSSQIEGVDIVTVVTEGIFSYCGVKVKIDTDRYIGPEQAAVRVNGEPIGHVTTAEYGSQMMALGGVRHFTGGTRNEGNVTCDALLQLCNKQPVSLSVDGGAKLIVQGGKAPVINGVEEQRMRVGCGSAAIGIFAKQWKELVDEVIVVDDHITGVLTEHPAGRFLGMRPAGIRVRGRRSTAGRYFCVAQPGTGWGGTDIEDPLSIIQRIAPDKAWPGLRLLMVSTTGEHFAFYVLDEKLVPQTVSVPPAVVAAIERVGENCEAAMCSVLFMGGAGGSLRAGVTQNPVRLTRSIHQRLTRVTSGGAPAYVWPGGGITMMVDVLEMPDGSFGYVPTPALVAPIEFTLRREDYVALGGHADQIRSIESIQATERVKPLAKDAVGNLRR